MARALLRMLVSVVDMWSMSRGSDRVGRFSFSQLLLFGVMPVSDPPSCVAVDSWHLLRTTGEIGVSVHHYQTKVARAQSCIAPFNGCFGLAHRCLWAYQLWRADLFNFPDYLESKRAPAWPWILTWWDPWFIFFMSCCYTTDQWETDALADSPSHSSLSFCYCFY